MTIEDDKKRYGAALHGMQSGVKFLLENELDNQGLPEPLLRVLKHLRVGINSALSDSVALAKLLMDKGLFTEAEYFKTQADFMVQEKERYEQQISQLLGKTVTLG